MPSFTPLYAVVIVCVVPRLNKKVSPAAAKPSEKAL
jgi:hypothetical protein